MLAARTGATADAEWLEFPPPTRTGHAAMYDPVRDRMLIFGGNEGGARNEVWALAIAGDPVWTKLNPNGTAPSARQHSAIYDPLRDRMLVFGGWGPGYPGQRSNDVWALSLAEPPSWTLVATEGTPPSPRADHCAVYDPVADRMLVFGGVGDDVVWELSLAGTPTWSPLPVAGSTPGPRSRHSAIYDPIRRRMVIFGPHNTTWALALDGTPKWLQITRPGAQPESRYDHFAVYDAPRDRMLVIGGDNGVWDLIGSWALPLAGNAEWQQLPFHPRSDHAGIYDPVRDYVIVHGGYFGYDGPPPGNSTSRLSLAGTPSWSGYSPTSGWPINRWGHVAVFDPTPGRMVIFGGTFDAGIDPDTLDDTWIFSLTGEPLWTWVSAYGPNRRFRHTAVYDPLRDRMLVFGGDPFYGNPYNDSWALSLGDTPAWSAVAPSGVPPSPRGGHSAIYDPLRDRMIIFGGKESWDGGMRFNDVWELSFPGGPQWTQLTPLGAPPSPREEHSAIYDSGLDRMIVFGGAEGFSEKNDVWALSLAGPPAWVELVPGGSPPSPRAAHSAVYDAIRERMIVFGGTDADAWALDLAGSPSWSLLDVVGPPPGDRYEHTAVYDPAADRMVVYSDITVTALDFFESTFVEESSPRPQRFALLGARPNPTFGELAVWFELEGTEAASLELFDVTGRRLAARSVGSWGPGRHMIRLGGERLSAGVYLVRLTRRGDVLASKVSVLR